LNDNNSILLDTELKAKITAFKTERLAERRQAREQSALEKMDTTE